MGGRSTPPGASGNSRDCRTAPFSRQEHAATTHAVWTARFKRLHFNDQDKVAFSYFTGSDVLSICQMTAPADPINNTPATSVMSTFPYVRSRTLIADLVRSWAKSWDIVWHCVVAGVGRTCCHGTTGDV